MKSVRRKARVAYSAAQMFDLVSDVSAYPEFLPWCRGARVHNLSEDRLEATLEVGVGAVTRQFSTSVRLDRPRRLDIELLAGPFRKLSGTWRFDDVESNGCDVALALDFEVTSLPLKLVFEALFEEMVRSQMNAFVERAGQIYG